MSEILFEPTWLGAIAIPNRIVMAPMTRMRAGDGAAPTPLNAKYYAQRATAGLIITEGTAVSELGQGYPHAPGIYTDAQVQGWRQVAEAVHANGGKIVMQIAHNGRNSHSSLFARHMLPVAPSPIPPGIPVLTRNFHEVVAESPRSLTAREIEQTVEDFRLAAVRALDAGFDGVELQGANSHLIDQFLEDGSNARVDRYGGSVENRMAFLLEVVDRVGSAIGKERLGVRLSPFGQYGGIKDSNPLRLFTAVVKVLSSTRIAYLHLIEARASEIGLREGIKENGLNNARLFREYFDGPLISAGGYTPDSASKTIADGYADAVAFGRAYTSNPDLVERIRNRSPLQAHDRSTFYGGGEAGYTDIVSLNP